MSQGPDLTSSPKQVIDNFVLVGDPDYMKPDDIRDSIAKAALEYAVMRLIDVQDELGPPTNELIEQRRKKAPSFLQKTSERKDLPDPDDLGTMSITEAKQKTVELVKQIIIETKDKERVEGELGRIEQNAEARKELKERRAAKNESKAREKGDKAEGKGT